MLNKCLLKDKLVALLTHYHHVISMGAFNNMSKRNMDVEPKLLGLDHRSKNPG